MSEVGLSAMGSTLAERKAFREAQEAPKPEEKAVEPEGETVENKAVARKRTSKK